LVSCFGAKYLILNCKLVTASRYNCKNVFQQGAFRINLEGTGFVVDPATRWRSYGVQSVRRTHRSHVSLLCMFS